MSSTAGKNTACLGNRVLLGSWRAERWELGLWCQDGPASERLGRHVKELALGAGGYHERLLEGVCNLMTAGEMAGDNLFFSGLFNREHQCI